MIGYITSIYCMANIIQHMCCRWVFVVLFLLPMSLLYDVYYYARCWIIFKFNSAPKHHANKLAAVQKQVIDIMQEVQEMIVDIQHFILGVPCYLLNSFCGKFYTQVCFCICFCIFFLTRFLIMNRIRINMGDF